MDNGNGNSEAPGWEAIDAVFEAIYPGQKPLHWGPVIHWKMGGKDPLDGISAYRHGGSNPHWHLVTYGLSELYAKESSDPAASGYGIELTFRLSAAPGEETPPVWSLNFLQNLARYVFQTGNVFGAGHHMHLNGPIALGTDTAIHAILLLQDPEALQVETPNGRVEFLQVTGITEDELRAAKAWNTRAFAALAETRSPLAVTDLTRTSLMADPAFAAAVAEGIAKDGSSTGSLYVDCAGWREGGEAGRPHLHVMLGAVAAGEAAAILPGRAPFGRDLMLMSSSQGIVFVPGDACGWTLSDEAPNRVRVALTAAAAKSLGQSLRRERGLYRIAEFPGLTVEVEPSEIKDAQGNVLQVIG